MLTRELLAPPAQGGAAHPSRQRAPPGDDGRARPGGEVRPADDRSRRAPPLHGGERRRQPRGLPRAGSSTPSRCCRRPRRSSGCRTRWWRTRRATGSATSRCATARSSAPAAGSPWRRRSRPSCAAWPGASGTSASITRVINCSLRHYAPEMSLAIARLSVAYRDRGVVAFDLAGGEAGRPPGVHQAAFDVAADGCLGITVHAGEAAGAASIAEAVHRCHADRIGHGTRLYEDPVLRDYLRDRRLPHRDQHHQQRADPGRGPGRGASGPRLLRRRARGHALHRRLAHERRVADRRVLAGAHASSGFTRAEIDR